MFMDTLESRFEELSQKCSQLNETVSLKFTWVDPKNQLAFSLPPKCASTSLRIIQMAKSGFIEKSGLDLRNLEEFHVTEIWPVTEKKHGLIRLDIAIERFGLDFVNNFTFVGVIRDPIQRLVSGYKDKIGRGDLEVSKQWFYELYGRKIIEKYRNVKTPEEEKDAIKAGLIPTFPEFVKFLLYENGIPESLDPHWKPQTQLTPFCQFNYKYVLKVEELSTELPILLNYLQLTMGYESLNLGQSHKTGINETIESEFIHQLDDSDRKKLFSEIYKNDYLLLEKFYKADLLTS